MKDATRRISEHAIALARLEAELARLELAAKGKLLGTAAGLGAAGLVLALIALVFALAAVAVSLDLVLPLWVSLLVVAGGVLLVAAVLALAARRSARRGSPPVPRGALDEANATRAALRATNGP